MLRHSPFAVLCLLLGACRPAPPAAAPPPPSVTVCKPIQHEVTDWDEYTGHLQSPENATVQARVSGFIEETPFKEGALVKKGDTLFVIDARPFEADLENKQATVKKDAAQLELAKTQLDRFETLLKQHAIAQQDFDTNKANFSQAEAQLAADQAAVRTAALNLDWTKVTAPINGRIGRIEVTVGNLVNGGAGQATTLTSIVSVDPIYCYAPIPERNFLRYQQYAAKTSDENVRDAKIPCSIKLEGEAKFNRPGIIDFIDNTLETTTGTIQVRGVLPNPKGELTPGLFAEMRITGSGPYQGMLIPDAAVGTEQSERFLLVVGLDGTVSSRPVKLGRLFGSLRNITEGLKLGERVVVKGLQAARPGGKVTPTEEPVDPQALAALDDGSAGGAEAKR